jgi:hypothetical protein
VREIVEREAFGISPWRLSNRGRFCDVILSDVGPASALLAGERPWGCDTLRGVFITLGVIQWMGSRSAV